MVLPNSCKNDNLSTAYEKRDLIVSNEFGTTILEPAFIKLGYSENTIPGIALNDLDDNITLNQSDKEVDLLSYYKYGSNYSIIETKFPNNNYIKHTKLYIITGGLGVYDIIVKIDSKVFIIRINDD